MAFFSFNKPAGACPACTGLGTAYTANLPRILDADKSLTDGAVLLWDPRIVARYIEILRAAGRHYGFDFDPSVPVRALRPAQRSHPEIAAAFGVPLSTVDKWWQRWRATLSCAARPHGGGQARRLGTCEAVIRTAVKRQPAITLAR